MNTHRTSILLVDDQQFVGVALRRLLAGDPDLELHCCHSPAEALGTARRVAPALILQDLVLPDVDGLSLVRAFRNDPATRAVPVVVLSGKDDPATRARAVEAGAADYLVKLPARDVLLASLRRHLAGTGAPSGIASPVTADASAGAPLQTLDATVITALGAGASGDAAVFVTSLIDEFVTETTSLVSRLHAAVEPLDRAALQRAAHSLRGTSMTLGAQRLAALSAQAEDQAARPASPVESTLVRAIQEELVRVHTACRSERNRLTGTPRA